MPARTPTKAILRRRDPRFLAERLLPRHLLTAASNASLDLATSRRDRPLIQAACDTALQELVALGLYTEALPRRASWRTYRSTSTGDRIHLLWPARTEQQASRPTQTTLAQASPSPQTLVTGPQAKIGLSRQDEEVSDALIREPREPETLGLEDLFLAGDETEGPSTPSATVPQPSAPLHDAILPTRVEGETLARLGGLLDLAGIETRLTSLADRLRGLLEQIERLLPGAHARILHLESVATAELGNGSLRRLTQKDVDRTPHFQAALERRTPQFATTAPQGLDPDRGDLAAVVPLVVGGAPWGLLEITWPEGQKQATRNAAPLLGAMARLVELAIQNQQTLESLVAVDALTGVYNRAFYDRQLALEMERAHRTNRKFALLVMDIDDFKAINDRHGHRAGDQVLSGLAQEMHERMRKIDLLFRYGGEEFVLLLPGAEEEEARRTAERLRSVVEVRRFDVDGAPAPIGVTVSIGGAIYPDDARTATGLFRHADGALYAAKEAGKNRVVFR